MQTYIRYFCFLATFGIGIGLAACGGYTTITLGGTVTGLTQDGLVLANGNNTIAIPKNATSYQFPGTIGTQDEYSVTVQTQPRGLTCTIPNAASGSAHGVSIDFVDVSCTENKHALTGTIVNNGASATTGLVLVNGSEETLTPAVVAAGQTGTLAFVNLIPELTNDANGNPVQTPFGVSVLTQPSGLNCTVANGTGVMGTADVTDIVVTCQ